MTQIETKNKFGKVICTTTYDAANNWISADWKGFVTVEDIKTWSNHFMEILNATNCSNLLNSNKELHGPWQQANQWIATELTPKLIAGGLKNYAHIMSPDIFAECSAKDLAKKVGGIGLNMRIFKDSVEAQNWLKSVDR